MVPTTWTDVGAAWRKTLMDLSGTRTQAGYVGLGLAIYSVVERIASPETVIGMLLGAWGIVKVMQQRKENGPNTK